ncbi:succinate--CoA ligase subunit alpha [Bacillus yapensis]|uniref:succinate--CoA ligase subunit alpha n=1 Tax=Bacillus yapensis TaxID=2492960 RepID=UPI001FE52C9B|nr:succinate--CoA ligase subunit alpha [Bacillus yapensis]
MLINENTSVLVQGLTSYTAKKHAINMRANNTRIIAGVSPGKGGSYVEDWPIYDTVRQALNKHTIDLSIIYAPPQSAANAIIESIESEIKIIVCVTEGIPKLDMLKVYEKLSKSKTRLLGPCTPGITVPGKTKIGFLPDIITLPGNVGVVGKSGTLTYEICYQLTKEGIGQSTIMGIGGDPIRGTSFKEVLKLFNEDGETDYIVMVGEIGGNDEEEAATFLDNNNSKPVVAYIAGRTAPKDVPMGHAGALIANNQGGYAQKIQYLQESGVQVATSISEVVTILKKMMGEKKK